MTRIQYLQAAGAVAFMVFLAVIMALFGSGA